MPDPITADDVRAMFAAIPVGAQVLSREVARMIGLEYVRMFMDFRRDPDRAAAAARQHARICVTLWPEGVGR